MYYRKIACNRMKRFPGRRFLPPGVWWRKYWGDRMNEPVLPRQDTDKEKMIRHPEDCYQGEMEVEVLGRHTGFADTFPKEM